MSTGYYLLAFVVILALAQAYREERADRARQNARQGLRLVIGGKSP